MPLRLIKQPFELGREVRPDHGRYVVPDRERWLPARLARRWGAMLWIGPVLGLLTGAALVFGFLKANQSRRVDLEAGLLPAGVDTSAYMARLRDELASEATLMELQQELSEEEDRWTPPLLWLRPRVNVASSSTQSGTDNATWGQIHMIFTNHSEAGLDRLDDAFQTLSRKVVPRVRSDYRDDWRDQLETRLEEIEEAIHMTETSTGTVGRKNIPLVNERDRLKNDLEWLMGDGALGYEVAIAGSIPSGPSLPWWQSPPSYIVLIAKCTGYGLLAAFPAMFALEGLCPRHEAESRRPAADQPTP